MCVIGYNKATDKEISKEKAPTEEIVTGTETILPIRATATVTAKTALKSALISPGIAKQRIARTHLNAVKRYLRLTVTAGSVKPAAQQIALMVLILALRIVLLPEQIAFFKK